MRVCLLLAAFALSLGFAAAAEAKTRIAAPTGIASGDCTVTPCTLTHAAANATAGDEILVRTGTYPTLTKGIVITAPSVSIRGELGTPMPRILIAAPGNPENVFAIILAGAGGSIAHLEVVATLPGLSAVYCGGGALVEGVRALVSESGTAIAGDASCTVSNSLMVGRGAGSTGFRASSYDAGPTSATVRNSTAIGATAIEVSHQAPGNEGSMTLSMTDTIAQGTEADLVAAAEQGKATIVASHSNFNETVVVPPGGEIIEAGGNQGAQPRFVDPANGNFAEALGSPTIDAGVLLPGMPTLDLAGNPRVLGGRIDIGAFEFVPPAGPPDPPPTAAPPALAGPAAPAVSSLKLSPRAFRVSGKGKRSPLGTTVSYSLSAPGTVNFTVQRKSNGRRVAGKCVGQTRGNASKPACPLFKPLRGSFSRAGAAGANSFRFDGKLGGKALAPGAYRLLATAGAGSSPAGFTIVE